MSLRITLKNGSAEEARTRTALLGLLRKYDLTGWTFTEIIEVGDSAMPHSHPVMTLSAKPRDDARLLAEFLHEQLHWYEEENSVNRDRAIERTKRYYPQVAERRPEGSGDDYSTRLHLIVCYLEYQALKQVLGMRAARETIAGLGEHHYRWIYRTVLKDERVLGTIVRDFDLLPTPLRVSRE